MGGYKEAIKFIIYNYITVNKLSAEQLIVTVIYYLALAITFVYHC